MNPVRVRFIGGPLNGQTVWIEADRASLSVQVAGKSDGVKQALEYRRDGDLLLFIEPVTPANG
ncbi:MAG: hypothetical protein HY560_08130 [Gemmatimonadetes bacterium]|nr:hypothetical protein [Gemmatimonadota bacterium]